MTDPRSPITATLDIDTRRFVRAMRSAGRTVRQVQRNRSSRPVSAERREIQRLGRIEMARAEKWLHDRMARMYAELGLTDRSAPTEGEQ